MTDRVQKADGHQITHEVLQRAIAIDRNCNFEDVKVQEISKSHGSNKGENFTCVLFALDIKAIVNDRAEAEKDTFHYMAKCLPANPYRAKFLNEINGFSRECYVYQSLMKTYQSIRKDNGLEELRIPKVHWADASDGIILMENLKAKGLTMLDRVNGEETNFDMALLVLQNIASFHATGYHFLQNYKNGVEGFKKDNPHFFNITGWITPVDQPEGKILMEKVQASMSKRTIGLLKNYGGSEDLIGKMETFLSRQSQALIDFHKIKDQYKFQTLNHNDLHMNNVMYKKAKNGKCEEVTLLDLQLMKYGRPTLDLAYFFGSSTTVEFRKEHLETLLEEYHKKLSEELKVFGYENIYSFDDLLSDFQETWGFGFMIGQFHAHILNMSILPVDGFDKQDPTKMLDEKYRDEFRIRIEKLQVEHAVNHKPYVDKVFSLVQEAAEKHII